MRFEASQHMKLGQQMKLTPRMIQSMEILQMSLAELEERIEQELENNVTLELAETEADPAALDRERKESDREALAEDQTLKVGEPSGSADFERLDSFEQSHPEITAGESSPRERAEEYEPRRVAPDGERDAKMDAMAAAPARGASLTDQFLEQWALADVDPAIRPLGEVLITFLDDDGYLRTSLETIADRAPAHRARPTVPDLERALRAVQLILEPPGVAARDMRECLLLQLDAPTTDQTRGSPQDRAIARRLVGEHLDDLMHNRFPRIAEKTGLDLDAIKRGVQVMRGLSLAPARRLVNETTPPIIPDAIVEYDEEHDRYFAYLNESRVPNLRINREYAEMSRDRAFPKKDREFIRTNLSNAQWLIEAVQQRKATLLRVINAVVEAQRDFFDLGPHALKTLPMTQVADRLGIHVATVSRAVADKHLLTPRGVVPLRRFFTGGLSTEGGGDMSYDAVRAALSEIVAAEDKSKPLSDDALADALKARGIEIARRTVAKYRDQLGVPSARMRKTF
ncbi:MAG: RNA polymerase factor sigma-54 [Phycisphaerales bacterium]